MSCLHAVFGQEFGEIVSFYPEMTTGEPKRWQLPGCNPPQYGRVADSTTLGNITDRNIFWTPLLGCVLQANLPVILWLLSEFNRFFHSVELSFDR
jgi:hypothetical protein